MPVTEHLPTSVIAYDSVLGQIPSETYKTGTSSLLMLSCPWQVEVSLVWTKRSFLLGIQ